jgi:hypothetical protein
VEHDWGPLCGWEPSGAYPVPMTRAEFEAELGRSPSYRLGKEVPQ